MEVKYTEKGSFFMSYSWIGDWQCLRHMIWCKQSHMIFWLCLKSDLLNFFSRKLFVLHISSKTSTNSQIKRLSRPCTLYFLHWKINMTSSIITSSLDLDEGFYCVKSVRIRSFSGPYFPAFWLNTPYPYISVFSPNMGKYRPE